MWRNSVLFTNTLHSLSMACIADCCSVHSTTRKMQNGLKLETSTEDSSLNCVSTTTRKAASLSSLCQRIKPANTCPSSWLNSQSKPSTIQMLLLQSVKTLSYRQLSVVAAMTNIVFHVTCGQNKKVINSSVFPCETTLKVPSISLRSQRYFNAQMMTSTIGLMGCVILCTVLK